MKKSEQHCFKLPAVERKWFKCPHCGKKLVLYDNTAKASGVFIKCKNCKNEVELKI